MERDAVKELTRTIVWLKTLPRQESVPKVDIIGGVHRHNFTLLFFFLHEQSRSELSDSFDARTQRLQTFWANAHFGDKEGRNESASDRLRANSLRLGSLNQCEE